MSHSKAICPKCGAEILVDPSDEASICSHCGAPFITEKAIEAFLSSIRETDISDDDPDIFPYSYNITIEREKNRIIRNSVTFILILDGRPRPLADDSIITLQENRKHFEIPVFITDNAKKRFEGVLTGIADGNDIRIVWSVDPKLKTLGVIKETTNSTVYFQERPGATRW